MLPGRWGQIAMVAIIVAVYVLAPWLRKWRNDTTPFMLIYRKRRWYWFGTMEIYCRCERCRKPSRMALPEDFTDLLTRELVPSYCKECRKAKIHELMGEGRPSRQAGELA